jgi:hypothetical protein
MLRIRSLCRTSMSSCPAFFDTTRPRYGGRQSGKEDVTSDLHRSRAFRVGPASTTMSSGRVACAACRPHPRVRSTNLSRRAWIASGESSTTRCAREPDFFRFPAFRVICVSVLSARDRPIPPRLRGWGPPIASSPVRKYVECTCATCRQVVRRFRRWETGLVCPLLLRLAQTDSVQSSGRSRQSRP